MINFSEELKNAMKSHDEVRKTVLRNIKAAKLNFESQPGSKRPEYTEEAEIKLIQKMAKELKDTLDKIKEGGREGCDLWNETTAQLEVVNEYLPKQTTEEEIREEVKKYFIASGFDYPYPKSQMGKCIGHVKSVLKGVDGSKLASTVKEYIE